MVLSQFFVERDCTVLYRPIADEKKLREINHMPYETLRPQFRLQVEDMIKKVFLNLKPKLIEGQTMSGKMFVELSNQYVKAMNSDTVPTITTAWERVIDNEINRVYVDAVEKFKKFVEEKISN